MVRTRSSSKKYNQYRKGWGDPWNRLTLEPGLLKESNSFSTFLVDRKRHSTRDKKGPITRGPLSNKEIREIKFSQRISKYPWIEEIPYPPSSRNKFQEAVKRIREETPSQPFGIVWPDLAIQTARTEEGKLVFLCHPQDLRSKLPRNYPSENFVYCRPRYLKKFHWWDE